MSSTEATEATVRLDKDRRLSMPLALLFIILSVVAVSYATWSETRQEVTQHSHAIEDLKIEAKSTREILIRIDENVKDLRRAQRRPIDSP